MPATERRIDRVRRETGRALADAGRDIRLARLAHDLSQETAARAAGISQSAWGRLERGEATNVPVDVVARAASTVGLVLHIRTYPGGRPLRDASHLDLLERLHTRLPRAVGWRTEVPFPNRGDKRAWDALIRVGSVLVGVEAETRVRDAQELQRRLGLKSRDGGATFVVLLLGDTRHNRTVLRSLGEGFHTDYPVPGPLALARLQRGEDPGGNSIILL